MKEHSLLHYFWHPTPDQIPSRILFVALNILVWIISGICIYLALQWVNKPFPGFLVNERMVIGNFGVYQWTGTRVGMKTPDRIVSANGQRLGSTEDLNSVVRGVEVGEPISYEIERNGELRTIEVATMRFEWLDLFMTFGITFFTGVAYLTLGFIVYLMKPNTPMTWAFLWVSTLLGIYSITSFDIQSTHWGLVRLAMLAFAFVPAAIVHLSFVFPEPRRFIVRFPFLRWVPYGVSLFLGIAMAYYYPDPRFFGVNRLVGLFMILSALTFLTMTLWTFYSGTSHVARQRSKVVLLGSFLAFPLPAVGQAVTYYGGTLAGVPIQNNFWAFPLLLFPAAISYSIVKHNLFDVDVYIKRAVGYALMTTILGALYFSFQTGLRTFVLDPIFGEASEQIYPILFALLVVFFFNPVNRFIQNFIDEVFFRKAFDYKDTIASVSTALTSLLDRQAVIFQLVNTVRTNMFVDTVGVAVGDSHRDDLSLFSLGEQNGPTQSLNQIAEQHLSKNDPLFQLVMREKKLITKYDVQESPAYADDKETCEPRFSELGASLLLPLLHQNEVTGMMAVGYKKSGHFYSREDVELLETLTNQGATALENARLADEMKREEGVRANLARYLSPQIVDQVIHNNMNVNLDGDRKVVTILFSDIRNFTTITETRPPDQLVAILNEYFTEMAKIIFANQGSLDKYIGDAIVAVFGSLIPLENPALSAARASIEMMQQMPILNKKWMKEYHFGMDIGIGLNTGEVFLGNVGSPERMEFMVIGDTVNVASRFSGLAKAGQILMTRGTLAALGQTLPYKELPPSAVKGKAEKLEVFEVVCD